MIELARAISLVLALVLAADASATTEYQLLTSAEFFNNLGRSVAVSGDVLVAGAPGTGAARVYRRAGAGYTLEQILEAPDGGSLGGGAIDSDVIAVEGTGGVYVFRWNGASFAFEQKLSVTFTGSVSLSGPVIAVRTRVDTVKVFRFDGAVWVDEQDLSPVLGLFSQGLFAAVSGDVIAIGQRPGSGEPGSDSVYVYRWNGSTWNFEQQLFALDDDPDAAFGAALAVEGDRIVVGAPNDDVPAGSYSAGSVYVFDRVAGTWVQQQKLVTFSGDQLGIALALSGDLLLASAPADGAAEKLRLYQKVGTTWTLVSTLTPGSEPCALFGRTIGLANDVAVSGAPYWSSSDCAGPVNQNGAVYVFDASVCGNGAQGPTESCDDGNIASGDGCSATCQLEPCNDTIDNDGDGFTDFPADPGCENAGAIENPKCQNGLDDDGDTKFDFDGGAAANGGVLLGPVDPQCTVAWKNKEGTGGCGIGAELALLIGVAMRRRRRLA